MYISVQVSLQYIAVHYLSFFSAKFKPFFSKHFLLQPNFNQINAADAMIVNLI